MNDREVAVHYYEMLTGVFNDEESKIIRYVCFGVLLAGMLWAGVSYFRASIYSDTRTPLDDSYRSPEPQVNTSALQRVVELARAVDGLRQAGSAMATKMESIRSMPFNLDSDTALDPFSTIVNVPEGVSVPTVSSSTSVPVPDTPSSPVPVLNVKMIMTDKDGRKLAVADVGGEKAMVLRRGDKLPNGGFVSSIRPDGISVIINKQETKYEVPEIPKYKKIK